jgi:hypothetical protein
VQLTTDTARLTIEPGQLHSRPSINNAAIVSVDGQHAQEHHNR